jgi:hypothetical protein
MGQAITGIRTHDFDAEGNEGHSENEQGNQEDRLEEIDFAGHRSVLVRRAVSVA